MEWRSPPPVGQGPEKAAWSVFTNWFFSTSRRARDVRCTDPQCVLLTTVSKTRRYCYPCVSADAGPPLQCWPLALHLGPADAQQPHHFSLSLSVSVSVAVAVAVAASVSVSVSVSLSLYFFLSLYVMRSRMCPSETSHLSACLRHVTLAKLLQGRDDAL